MKLRRWREVLFSLGILLELAVLVNLCHADNPYATTQVLSFAHGYCSGTSVGPQTLLTATHCLVTGGELKAVDGAPAKVTFTTSDGHDHTLMRVDGSFPMWANLDVDGPMQGDHVRYWGNPNGHPNLYREGYIAGYCIAPKECLDKTKVKGVDLTGPLYVLLTPGWNGDSGAGIFDDKGNVVAVVSARDTFAPTMPVVLAVPFHFTPAQLAEIR